MLAFEGSRQCIDSNITLPPFHCHVLQDSKYWQGTMEIPLDMLPPECTHVNMYGIHGQSPSRCYKSLYACPRELETPDFHRLTYFQPLPQSIPTPTAWKFLQDSSSTDQRTYR